MQGRDRDLRRLVVVEAAGWRLDHIPLFSQTGQPAGATAGAAARWACRHTGLSPDAGERSAVLKYSLKGRHTCAPTARSILAPPAASRNELPTPLKGRDSKN